MINHILYNWMVSFIFRYEIILIYNLKSFM